MSELFYSFWGKARPQEGAAATWHPAAYHCLDVAAVADALLRTHPTAAHRMARACGWSPGDFIRAVVFLISLHDIGKFSRSFQAKAPVHWPSALGPFRDIPGPRHDAIGLALLKDDKILEGLERVFPDWLDQQIEAFLSAVAGHHGRPAQESVLLESHIVCVPCCAAARAFAAAAADLLDPPALARPPNRIAEVTSWWLAGLTTLCDWVGSATLWFPYEGSAFASLEQYWPVARMRADRAVAESGLLPARPGASQGLAGLMPHIETPTPVQSLAELLPLPDGPVCVIVEDATGGGKTEAALVLAQRLIADGRADGLFIALPTMATADAMFDRMAGSYRRLFAANARPSLALAHGRAALNDLFQGSILGKAEAAPDHEAGDAAATASAQCAAWLAEERRRVFFADVGVGTIDQALLGVLAARYAALRLFGLAGKVLVVDEAHAYDAYMSEELDRLLTFHAMLGGSSIVLSATLPRGRRAGLLAAVASGLGAPPYDPVAVCYPLMTVAGRTGGMERHAPMRAKLRRHLSVRRLADAPAATAVLAAAARAGACGIWIRNTVDDAWAAAQALREAGIMPILFHARFAMGDRLAIQKDVLGWFGNGPEGTANRAPDGVGRVLVATQVVEQSLDLDADVMVTDLAPIELLIQRAGRLQRHPERVRPAGFETPDLWVVSPEPVAVPAHTWAADPALGGTRFVYPAHVLWRSARVLFGTGMIRTPEGVRELVEAVYGDAAEDLPPALLAAEAAAEGTNLAERGQARGNLLDPWKGYSYRNGQWAPDIVMPTRLGDDYTIFRMAREEQGQLVPWCAAADPEKAWALSEIALRRSIAEGANVPVRLAPVVDRLLAGWTPWQRQIPVFVLEPGEPGGWVTEALQKTKVVRLHYDRELGLSSASPDGTLSRKSRGAAER